MKKKWILVFASLLMGIVVHSQSTSGTTNVANSQVEVADNVYYNGNSATTVDDEGRVSGSIISYHGNGKLEETGLLLKGQKHGAWYKYSATGALLNEAHYKNGQKDDLWKIYDTNGVLRMKMSYDEGKRVGTWLMYDEAGKVTSEKTYN